MTKHLFRFTFFLLMCFIFPLVATAQTVTIPDPNLRAAIEGALGKTSGTTITAADMATLTLLEASKSNISDLTGLEGAPNLTGLNLEYNNIRDISVLAGLTNLTTLNLHNNDIGDISAVTRLTKLTGLYLSSTGIRDISVLAGLTNLTTLSLYRNDIGDISVLAGLTNLTTLNLGWSSISDISALAGLIKLTGLELWGNNISNISALVGLTNLTTLNLEYNNIRDISALAGLTKLTELLLGSNNIGDISALAGLTNLTELNLERNSISDISSLVVNAGLGSGDTVNVQDNPLTHASIRTHIPTLQNRGVSVEFTAVTFDETVNPDTPVTIPDPNLRAAIEAALGKTSGATITASDMATLTLLEASESNISDLTGLEWATNLTTLELNKNSISDLSVLAGLTNLTTLNLYQNNIRDISPVAGLTKLTTLWLPQNNISDISPVAGLTKLTALSLGDNPIGDISPVAELTNLTELDLSDNSISDISTVAGLTNLTALYLRRNAISDISALAGLTKLTWLNLYQNNISDISPVAGLTNLISLSLWDNNIRDISPVAGLTNLTWLNLWDNNIRDISPLVANTGLGSGNFVDVQGNPLSHTSIKTHIPTLQSRGVSVTFTTFDETVDPDTPVTIPDPNLRAAIEAALGKTSGVTITAWDMATLTRLEASESNISDLTGLEWATNLTWLGLYENNISDISPVAGLTNLTSLYLYENSISDISPVAGLTNLTRLSLGWNNISDISPLAGLTNLTTLRLSNTFINDISPVAGLTNLTVLSFACGSNISDISPLAGLTKLTDLNIWGDGFNDLSPLANLTNLTDLILTGRLIKDISAVAGLTKLTSLYLGDNPIGDISPVAGLTNLTTLSFSSSSISDISPLAGLTNLTTLSFYGNNIGDISALAGLTNLTSLKLYANNISNISPLVANTGLGSRDFVDVQGNPLSHTSIKTHIPTLQSRGVTVEFDDTTHLNVGQPYTVRLIYLLPSDRQPKLDIDTQMDTLIKEVQQAYADDMESYGFGGKTFRFETDATGKAVVHHVAGQFTADYYEEGTLSKVEEAIEEQFDTRRNIYLVVVDSGYLIGGAAGKATLGRGASGIAVINNIEHLSNYVYLASHELRHAFGLSHDYYIDSRGFTPKISRCTAELLDVHRYFNPVSQGQNPLSNTTIEMLPLSRASSSSAIRLRFEVTDPDGLHQARLLTPEVELVNGLAGGFIACKRLNGTSSTIEFVTTALTPKNESVSLGIIDVHGNISESPSYPIDLTTFHTTADVNRDGSVNILDLTLIASEIGNAEANLAADISGDGVVNILDLVLAAGIFGGTAAAPSIQPQAPETLTAVEVHQWLTDASSLEVRDPIMKRGIIVLEQLLVSLTPRETELLANYPNPFNPETWIPYRLAEDAFVTLTIYDLDGRVVRTLDVGHRIASAYENRSKAIYWDGRNELGEQVASGVYFYHLSAGDYSATRRMVILK